MPQIFKSPRAKSDLIEIWDYIAEDSEVRADAFVAKIHAKFLALAKRPGVGRVRDELEKDIRSFPVGRYLIFYRPLADGIEVVRVLHASRDVDALFDESD
ncbi:type II toxin-antitoxin system RelE/ParE family toxin [Desulfovibrio sulfodismutans]|uniref:Toxin n=1 Tax=Desulfolutivibrio sulfodismutans TaxID=63561 RepID=A0A7K3NLL1_9BACT|nr:type II toxin-antitoxin system RelE/ParE family toxin [Desulfolutivibrio sulfodismutans]NDY57080.1 type II toxin-antitoxin system RelE/ParE family toxin [Desulfolutivibrio sulfodismutans]QLA11709.1 type II toxin-antitoxin system RelE/ParE family toxin [Desulfolutivibrio sulfodismutans DSM 3696]